METYSDLIVDEKTGLELLYLDRDIDQVAFAKDVVEKFNQNCGLLDVDPIRDYIEYSQDFDIPTEYRYIDVVDYIANLVPDDIGRQQRVAEELSMFQARNLFPVLQMLIYIVDTMRKNGIVWGVGRGSSVASYCLYLIGVHRIDSYAYDLPINEFLK